MRISSSWTRVAIGATALASAVGGAVSAAPASAHARRHHRAKVTCSTARPYMQSSSVRIYRTHDDQLAAPTTVYHACLRPHGKPLTIALNSPGGEYPSDAILGQIALAGDYAGSLVQVGAGSASACEKYMQPNCPTPVESIHLVDVRTRLAANESGPVGTKDLVLSSAGGAAWLQPQAGGGWALMAGALTAAGSFAPQQEATGTISDVALNGLTLTWTNGGVPASATL